MQCLPLSKRTKTSIVQVVIRPSCRRLKNDQEAYDTSEYRTRHLLTAWLFRLFDSCPGYKAERMHQSDPDAPCLVAT